MRVYVCVFVHICSFLCLYLNFFAMGILAHGREICACVYVFMRLWILRVACHLRMPMDNGAEERKGLHIFRRLFCECNFHVHILQIECHSKVLNYAHTFWMVFIVCLCLGKSIVLNTLRNTYLFMFLSPSQAGTRKVSKLTVSYNCGDLCIIAL